MHKPHSKEGRINESKIKTTLLSPEAEETPSNPQSSKSENQGGEGGEVTLRRQGWQITQPQQPHGHQGTFHLGMMQALQMCQSSCNHPHGILTSSRRAPATYGQDCMHRMLNLSCRCAERNLR